MGPKPIRDLARLRSATRALKVALGREDSRYPVTEVDLVNSTEAELFEARVAELKRCLSPAGNSLAEPILALLTAMPSQSGAGLDQAMRLATFIEDLGDLPFFSVERACRDFRTGKAGDKHWAPTVAEIRDQAGCYVAPYRVELADLEEILEFGKEQRGQLEHAPDENERERVKAKFSELAASFRKVDPDAVSKTRAEAQAALDRMEAEGPWAPKLSERLRVTIKPATKPIETDEQLKECLR